MIARAAAPRSLLSGLTYARILAAPAVMGLILLGPNRSSAYAVAAADKLLVSGALIALVDVNRASPWIAAIIIGRELLILGLRGVVAAEGTVFAPSIWGKLKTNVQFLAIFLAILHFGDSIGPLRLDEWAMVAAAAITVMSAVEYLARFSSAFSEGLR